MVEAEAVVEGESGDKEDNNIGSTVYPHQDVPGSFIVVKVEERYVIREIEGEGGAGGDTYTEMTMTVTCRK